MFVSTGKQFFLASVFVATSYMLTTMELGNALIIVNKCELKVACTFMK